MGLLPFEERTRNILIKREAETSPAFGKRPSERSVKELLDNGVICLNKPQGPSSHQVADYVKHIVQVERVGHGGTLDPNVTGVLPTALNRATRVNQTLLVAGKEYVCLMHIHKPVEKEQVEKVFHGFLGLITQMVPRKAAVKRQERQRKVYYLELLEIDGQDVLFKMGAQAGTYVRKICDDMGKKLGTGAHMQQLVRTKAGPFNDAEWYSLHDIKDAFTLAQEGKEEQIRKVIKPVEFAVGHLPKVWVLDSAVDPLCHGANLSVPGVARMQAGIQKEELVAIFSLKDELVCIGNAVMTSEEMMKEEKGLAIKTSKVFMDPEVYPHFKKAP